jgi:hypothetical protein
MAGVIVHARQAFDDRRHARQRPQIGVEAVALRPPEQCALDPRQLPGIEPPFPAQPPRGFQSRPAAAPPDVIPAMCRLPTDPEPPHDRGLRRALHEQPRRFEPAGFQRSTAPLPLLWSGHASASDGTR